MAFRVSLHFLGAAYGKPFELNFLFSVDVGPHLHGTLGKTNQIHNNYQEVSSCQDQELGLRSLAEQAEMRARRHTGPNIDCEVDVTEA